MGQGHDISRRDFLSGAFRGRNVTLAATGALAWSHLLDESMGMEGPTLRPPGAQLEPDFLASCIKCGQCVEACPYDTLKLAKVEEGPAIGVPYFQPRATPCYMCEDIPCIAACPTDSLEKNTPIEESRMGLAVLVDHENCLAYRGLPCEICYRACPLMGEAIELDVQPPKKTGDHAYSLPIVNSDRCTGCGRCEHACILEQAAIKVLPHDLAQGKAGQHYHFEPEDESRSRHEWSASELPEWRENLDQVLEQMDDLEGIEER